MSLTMRGQLLNVLSVPARKDDKTGEVLSDGYNLAQLLSAEAVQNHGKRFQLHTFYIDDVSKAGTWVGREVEVPVRAYVDRKTQQQKFSVEDGAEIVLVQSPAKSAA